MPVVSAVVIAVVPAVMATVMIAVVREPGHSLVTMITVSAPIIRLPVIAAAVMAVVMPAAIVIVILLVMRSGRGIDDCVDDLIDRKTGGAERGHTDDREEDGEFLFHVFYFRVAGIETAGGGFLFTRRTRNGWAKCP